jgi:general secretion pathway protein C
MIKKSFTLANLLLITLAAYLGVGIFYKTLEARLITAPPPKTAVKPLQMVTKEERIHPESYYQPIMDRNLFKTKAAVAPVKKAPQINLEALKQTQLQLRLWGTVAGKKEGAYAVIEETKARKQNLYRVGDTIQNAKIKMIYRERVVLSVNGKDEILEIEKIQGGKARTSLASAARPSSSASSTRATRAQRITLKRSLIEDSIQDITKLMTQVQITPHLEDGVPAGLSLSNIKPNSIFRRMGLRNGDVLTGVDGQSIQSVDDALRLYDNLKSADSVQVQLKRRGRDKAIEYRIK